MTVAAARDTRIDIDLGRFATRHLLKPIGLLTAEAVAYLVCVWLAVICGDLGWKLVFAVLAGVLTATLAIIGHDCAHRGGTRYQWLNRLLGTIGFLPALHPLSRWAYHHNQVHHRYTAQLGLDNAFPPMTVDEYRAASPGRRLHYRFFRSLWGQPFFYLIEIWASKIIMPAPGEWKTLGRRDWTDLAIVYAWLVALPACMTFLAYNSSNVHGFGAAFADAVLFALVLPFLVWNVLISFVTVVQHTGPDVRWSVPTGRPSTIKQKLRGTVRIRFPEPVDILFHRLMQHGAHHLNPLVPLYSLKAAQRALEQTDAGPIVVRWTPSYHLKLTRTCVLYDPQGDGWCDFEGRPTTPARMPSAEAVG